jgi:hypothetical protein
MNKVKYLPHDGVSATLDHLATMYHNNEIKGLLVGVKAKDDEFFIINSETINYLESIGLANCMVQHLIYKSD